MDISSSNFQNFLGGGPPNPPTGFSLGIFECREERGADGKSASAECLVVAVLWEGEEGGAFNDLKT